MSILAAIQSMLPRPERRSESEIEDDLNDEFAFHLEMKTRELMNEGHAGQVANDLARQSFGDLQRIKKKCKRIALEERVMLQRVNFIMMVLVALVVVGVGLQVFITQRYNTLALQAITADLTRMKFDAKAADRSAGPGPDDRSGFVYIDGDVARPGVYGIPTVGRLTVKRLVAAAGDVKTNGDALISVSLIGSDGQSITKFTTERNGGTIQKDYVLSTDDHVHVQLSTEADATSAAKGESVLVQGDVERPGWYPIETHDGATYLSNVLEKAGLVDPDSQVEIYKNGQRSMIPRESLAHSGPRYVLLPGQDIRVKSAATLKHESDIMAAESPEPVFGEWRQVDENGAPVSNGATLSIMDRNDIRNLAGASQGTLTLPESGKKFGLRFSAKQSPDGLRIQREDGSDIGSRWSTKRLGDRTLLVINISPAVPGSQPLTFEHVDQTAARP